MTQLEPTSTKLNQIMQLFQITRLNFPNSLNIHPQNAVFTEPTDEMVVVKDIEMFR